MKLIALCVSTAILTFSTSAGCSAEVVASDKSGFQITVKQTCSADAASVFSSIVSDIGKWWDAAHTFSGDSANLKIDMQRRCLFEELPDGGFVRHLELVHVEQNQKLCFTGGLGPLQEMGVNGALTITLEQGESGTTITWRYNVSGFYPDGLDKIAPAVDRVLAGQLERLSTFAESQK